MKTLRTVASASKLSLLTPGERSVADDTRVDLLDVASIVHDYSIPEVRPADIRPIHAWTCLAVATIKRNTNLRDWGAYASLHMALEQKLSFVEHRLRVLKSSLAQVTPPSEDFGDYDQVFAIISDLESYLAAIYSTLEVVAALVREKTRRTPKSFSKLATQHVLLRFDRWHWLQHFWDLRTQLTHYGTLFLSPGDGTLVVRFSQSGTLRYFPNQRVEIPVADILDYRDHLLDMLDEWALSELDAIDPDWPHGIYVRDGRYARMEFEPSGVVLNAARARPRRPPLLVGPGLRAFVESDELVQRLDDLFAIAGRGKVALPSATFDWPARALRSIGVADVEQLRSLLTRYYPQLADLAVIHTRGEDLSPVWPGISVLFAACTAVQRVGTPEHGRDFARLFGAPPPPKPAGMLDVFDVIARLWRTKWATALRIG
ncbi:MAG: hypothetical protein L6Q84_03030 [Polyangiaceae bacterium]|nr:hypothetical protein [Polyangiaceae bacterium]